MKAKKGNLAVIAVIGLLLTSCYYHNWENLHPSGQVSATPCVLPDTVSYSNVIAPLLVTNCGVSGAQASTCHGVGGAGGNYSTYQKFSNVTSPDSLNNVYLDITWNPNAPHNMPLGGSKLSQCDINKIIRWMDQGSLNN
jgi:hypothetical protein